MSQSRDRRRFLKTAAVAAAAPMIVPSSVFCRTAPSNRINLSAIEDETFVATQHAELKQLMTDPTLVDKTHRAIEEKVSRK